MAFELTFGLAYQMSAKHKPLKDLQEVLQLSAGDGTWGENICTMRCAHTCSGRSERS
jgi:hypothetical protein